MSRNRLRPARAVRQFCLECKGGSCKLVAECLSIHCLLYPHRMGTGRVTLKVMRTYCLHCHGWPVKNGKLDPEYKGGGQAWARDQARNCTDWGCPIFDYRQGTRPYQGCGWGQKGPPTPSSVRISEQETPEIGPADIRLPFFIDAAQGGIQDEERRCEGTERQDRPG